MDQPVEQESTMASYAVDFKKFLQEKVDPRIALGAAAATSSALLLAYLYRKMPRGLSPPPERYPVSLEDQTRVGEDGERTSRISKKGKLTNCLYDDASTIHDSFKRGAKVSENGPCVGMRRGPNNEYEWTSYQEVLDRAQRIGSGLMNKGLTPGEEGIVGLYSANSVEWILCDQACAMYTLVTVPLYDTLGAEACCHIINQTKMKIVLCDKAEKAQALLDDIEKTPSLKYIVVFAPLSNNNLEEAQKHGVTLMSLVQLEDEGRANLKDPMPPKPSDVATICYTSGTTGPPKGVVLSHLNIISNVSAVIEHSGLNLTPNDVHISYLPLAHMMERTVQLALLTHGSRIGFFRGDVKLLLEDIATLRPTIFVTVPRLLNRIYDKVLQGVRSSWIKNKLFTTGFNSKKALLETGVITRSTMWDFLVFGKVQNLLGGRVRTILTGSAPLSGAVLDFARICFGCTVLEGYGQTECNACCTMTLPYEITGGHVGAPVPCNKVKLVDVEEMDYYARDNKGEVCIKGNNVMMGYFKDPEKTAETIDKDGWLHTGDIGQWLPTGALKLIDRKKHIFKLAQGEYLAPEKIENVYQRSALVAQCFLDGHSLETFPVAIVVPDPEVIPQWAGKRGLPTNQEEFCRNSTAKQEILKDMNKIGKEAGLKGFELAKKIHLHPELFTVENGFLTPTFKSKRPTLRKEFANVIDNLYKEAKEE